MDVATGDIDGDGRAEIVAGRVGDGQSRVRVFRPDGEPVQDIKGALPGQFPHGISVASADFNGDNYDDLAIGAGRGRAPRVVGLDGFTLGSTSTPTTLFDFEAPGGKKAGVNLAGGYFDRRTRPGLLANLITTPQSGPKVGRAQVWTPTQTEEHASSAHLGHTGSAAPRTTTSESPELMAKLRPTQKRIRGLAVTFLGKQGVNSLVAWRNPEKPRYVSIDDKGVVSDIPTPVRAQARDEQRPVRAPLIGPLGIEGDAAGNTKPATNRQEPVAEPIKPGEHLVVHRGNQRRDAVGDSGPDRGRVGMHRVSSLVCRLLSKSSR